MPIDFPGSPSVNDVHSDGGRSWTWNGTSWVLNTYVGVVPPSPVLTTPVFSGTATTASGNWVIQPASYILEVRGGGSTVGQIQLNCPANSHGQKIASQPHAQGATNTLTLPGGSTIGNSDAVLVSDIGIQTLSNKTITSPTINGAHTNLVKELIIQGLEERVNVVAAAATGTINIDVATSSIWYYTAAATANHTLNFRYNSSTTLSSKLAVGDAITIVWMNQTGSTAYYPNVIQIDGSTVTPKVPSAITAGNASSIDVYSFTIVKTTATPTYQVLETQTKFA